STTSTVTETGSSMSERAASTAPQAPPAEPDEDSQWRDWIDQLEEPAAPLRPVPWRFMANASLDVLLAHASRDASALTAAFSAGGGQCGKDLLSLLAADQAFGGRVSLKHTARPDAPTLLHADFAPLPHSDGLWLCTCIE